MKVNFGTPKKVPKNPFFPNFRPPPWSTEKIETSFMYPPRIHIVTFGKKWPYTNNTQGSIKKVTIQVSLKGLYSDIEPAVLSLYGCFLVSQCDHILTIHWQYMAIKKKVTIQIRIRAPYIDNCSAVLSPYGCFFVIHPDNIPTIHRQCIACSKKRAMNISAGMPSPIYPLFHKFVGDSTGPGPAKRWSPCCVNTAGKLRLKW